MVRGGLAGYVQALALGFADCGEGLRGGDMLDVQMGSQFVLSFNFAQKANIALDDIRLGLNRHATQAEAEGNRAGVHTATAGQPRVFRMLRNR